MASLQLRPEFLAKHMKATAIELSNRQNTGWAQRRDPSSLLDISYPTADVQRALAAVSVTSAGRPVVLLGQRGSGKSHLMALLHYAFGAPEQVENWSRAWGDRLGAAKLLDLQLQRGFSPISETLSNQEYPCLWDVIFERHARGPYFRGKFEQAGTLIPSKSLLQDMFSEQRTALIFDELQTWFDGMQNEPGPHGRPLREWAYNFVQILSELAKDRPDLLCLVVSVRDNTTEAYRQIHRIAPFLVDFKGETSREDRKRLVLHRLFQNRSQIADAEIEHVVDVYANERNRLLYADKTDADKVRLKSEVVASWPFAPELLNLLEDHILMAAAAQDNRDLIRILAEVYRERGAEVPLVTVADFHVDNADCGVTSLLDSFATSADQEKLREVAIRNLQDLHGTDCEAPHAREVISSLWMRSLSTAQDVGGSRQEAQLDITRTIPIDDNSFSNELATIVENSFNIHEVGTHEKRFCFKLPVNPESRLKVHARNDNNFKPQVAAAPGLLSVGRDQEFLRTVLNYVLKSPEGTNEQPSQPIVLDPNWEKSPWANVSDSDKPVSWAERGIPVLIVLPVAPREIAETLGPWLVEHVSVNRNMSRFLLPKQGTPNIFDDRDLLVMARCALLAKEWKANDSQYDKLHKKYEGSLKTELKSRFDRYAILGIWDFQQPKNCTFHVESHAATGSDIPLAIETHLRTNFLALEDVRKVVVEAARRGDTIGQLLSTLREPALPGSATIPFVGDNLTYEICLSFAARDEIALDVGGRWFHKEPDETERDALARLRSKAWKTGRDLLSIRLGEPSQVGSTGVAAVPQPPTLFPPNIPPTTPTPGGITPTVVSPTGIPTVPVLPVTGNGPIAPTLPAQPIIRQSIGAKTGINLLGDLERWALPDQQRVTQASLTVSGVTVKELRELVTKLPPRIQAELQVTLPPEPGATT